MAMKVHHAWPPSLAPVWTGGKRRYRAALRHKERVLPCEGGHPLSIHRSTASRTATRAESSSTILYWIICAAVQPHRRRHLRTKGANLQECRQKSASPGSESHRTAKDGCASPGGPCQAIGLNVGCQDVRSKEQQTKQGLRPCRLPTSHKWRRRRSWTGARNGITLHSPNP